ncbi:hypothetical protein VCR14J2_620071 [Vibrio coralliirubri]|nr:hypothetical protein VCR1J2_400128 [Vibrio coralliirubri]CDT52472.1 hypothetical protein VCR26J2_180071 [Vibrio coralliirubri]CDT99451.1 hypothetical protein VCR8J2_60125 [Vibrio coralliirubri]CDU02398.1 hypothetical protein VCR12J2_620790 [Vibrio coralliirubri]CDU03831.1 hypothetical protein VCR3J2_80061 [Vibrio coralliirubri]
MNPLVLSICHRGTNHAPQINHSMNIIEDSLKLFDFIIMSFSTVGYANDGISNDNTNTIPLRLFCDLIIRCISNRSTLYDHRSCCFEQGWSLKY